ncbi:adenosylcobinamide-GDP ribazoletransferase [Macromonas nakdongensis]|uniref:adenosylcobinamide-GDP ribazoletransferase n=1 Tax=Macromonas nakdongensis TaxID=1843082 RepID=UPI000C34565E|nr:adenosylcobinamide-GDP ribazoletransferase [Macromonas nakdongensis]
MQGVRHFLLALQFFTRLPVTGALARWVGYSPAMLRASAAHFPGVGWVVGAAAAGVYGALCWHLPPVGGITWVAAVFCTLATVLLTGGFHEDGLADLTDGLGGSYRRERALEIMKDSRIGAFGAMALVLALLAKVGLLAVLGQLSLAGALLALWLAHVASRTWPLLTIRWLPHVGDAAGSKSKPLADQISTGALWAGALWLGLAVVLAGWAAHTLAPPWLGGLVSGERTAAVLAWGLGGSVAGWALVHWRLKVRLQGFTGDGLGAAQQVSEIGFYLAMALAMGAR